MGQVDRLAPAKPGRAAAAGVTRGRMGAGDNEERSTSLGSTNWARGEAAAQS